MNAYPVYEKRTVRDLSGIWDFFFIPKEMMKLDSFTPDGLQYDDFQIVPGCFDAAPKYASQRGTGVYRTFFNLSKSGKCLLRIGGVSLYAKFFVDGVEIGSNPLPYSGFECEFEATEGRHELVVAVSNAFDYKACPLFSSYYDFYAFGGILRSIEIHELPTNYLGRCHVTTLDIEKGRVDLKMEITSDEPQAKVNISFDNKSCETYIVDIKDGISNIVLDVPDFKLWSPESPSMHSVTIDMPTDKITESFGIRKVEVVGNKILINGNEFIARGYNRHESHPEAGSAVPECVMMEDIQILKDLNCNFVRGSHYPQSQMFLDMCDRAGIVVWEETIAWNDDADHLADPAFEKAQLEQLKLMIHNSYNHPSIIMWGFMNETSSEKTESYPLIEKLVKTSKTLDSSRPVTFASARCDNDICFGLVDIISTNVYPGWYGCNHDDERQYEKVKPRLAEVQAIAAKYNKPWIISEIGAAAIYGCRDRMNGPWSEEFQTKLISEVCDFVNESDYKPGLALWQFTDIRTYSSSGHLNRARGFNNKGSLDEYRRPKAACSLVREKFKKT